MADRACDTQSVEVLALHGGPNHQVAEESAVAGDIDVPGAGAQTVPDRLDGRGRAPLRDTITTSPSRPVSHSASTAPSMVSSL